MYIEYSSNNSGGGWWLTDQNWKDLEAAGWVVQWFSKYLHRDTGKKGYKLILQDGAPKLFDKPQDPKEHQFRDKVNDKGEHRWLGALATTAYRAGMTEDAAIAEWERITGECAEDEGCSCCGVPHNFSEYDDEGNWV